MNKNTKDYQLYFIQSTLVYVGTILAYFFLFPFFWINGVTPAIAIGIVAVGISLLSIYLNFKSYFAAASFIFLVSLSLLNGYATYLIGIDSGIMYVYLNLIGLAIFTNWHNRYKIMMISSIAIFALFVYHITIRSVTPYPLSLAATELMHSFNFIINLVGIANTSFIYQQIAEKAQSNLMKQANTDFLTKVSNRLELITLLTARIASYKSNPKSFGIIMADADYFKAINDEYGHLAGDEVLIHISRLLKSCLRNHDILGRYGGEEFMIICEVDSLEDLKNMTERMRSTINQDIFTYESNRINLSMSFGAAFISGQSEKITTDSLISLADEQLYKAKTNGRNRGFVVEV